MAYGKCKLLLYLKVDSNNLRLLRKYGSRPCFPILQDLEVRGKITPPFFQPPAIIFLKTNIHVVEVWNAMESPVLFSLILKFRLGFQHIIMSSASPLTFRRAAKWRWALHVEWAHLQARHSFHITIAKLLVMWLRHFSMIEKYPGGYSLHRVHHAEILKHAVASLRPW